MGVTLDLRLIDHEAIAVRGLRAVNEAIRASSPEPLRSYLLQLPVSIDPTVVELQETRLAKLREFEAPAIIIQNEEYRLRLASGEAYGQDVIRQATLDELRNLLGTWCWMTHSFSLDKSWDELQWFLEPKAGRDDLPLHPLRPRLGDPRQSIVDKALLGSVPYPLDDLGEPVIRTLGSHEPDCGGYNAPSTVTEIHATLSQVDPAVWAEQVPFRCELYRRANPDLGDEEIEDAAANDLAFARDAFPVLLAAFSRAAAKRYGVSCEYSL